MATRFCDIIHHTRGQTECYLPLEFIDQISTTYLTNFQYFITNLLITNKDIISSV